MGVEYVLVCEVPNFTTGTGPSVPICSSGWKIHPYVPPFDPSQIDPMVVAAMFSGGFLLYLTPWAAAWGFSSLLKMLR